MADSSISVERGLEIIEEGDRDILVYDGKYGPSIIQSGDSGEAFAYMWSVQRDHTESGGVKLRPAVSMSRDELRESFEESVKLNIEMQVVDPDVGSNPWVYNLFDA